MISLKQILTETNPFRQETLPQIAFDEADILAYFPKMTIANLNAVRAKIKRLQGSENETEREVSQQAINLITVELKKRISYIQGKRK